MKTTVMLAVLFVEDRGIHRQLHCARFSEQ